MNAKEILLSLTAVFSILPAFSSTAKADTIDITNALESTTDIDARAKSLCQGNACDGGLQSASLDYNDGPGDQGEIHATLRLHNVQHTCTGRPFGGKWCVNVYDYWVNVNIVATVDNCSIGSVIASSSNTLYQVPALFADLFANSSFFKLAVIDKNHFPGCQQ